MPAIGQLNQRVTLQSYAQAPAGGAGGSGITPVIADLADVWAQITTIKGAERISTVNAGEGATHRFTIRYRTDVTAEHLPHGSCFRLVGA